MRFLEIVALVVFSAVVLSALTLAIVLAGI